MRLGFCFDTNIKMIRLSLRSVPLYTKLNSVICQTLPPSLATIGPISRYTRSGPILYHKYANPEATETINEILMANSTGSLSHVVLSGTSSLCVQSKALFAFSSSLDVSSSSITGLDIVRISGVGLCPFLTSGDAVIGASGDINCVELTVGQEMYVDPLYLVAWESCLNAMPPPLSRLMLPSLWEKGDKVGSILTTRDRAFRYAIWVREAMKVWAVNGWRSLKRYAVGSKKMYRLEGPGSMYLSTRGK